MPTPSKFTRAVQQELCDAAQIGASRLMACRRAKIDEKTLRRWLAEGEKAPSGSPKRIFYQEFLAAEADPNFRALASIHRAIPDKPELAMKYLERREPAFAPPVPHAPVVQTSPVLIQLAFGDGRVMGGELVEGEVIDVQEEPTRPRRLTASPVAPRDPAS